MSFAEVLTAARELSADERAELVRELAVPQEPESEDALLARLFPPGCAFDVWSPFDAHEAAAALQQLLAQPREGL